MIIDLTNTAPLRSALVSPPNPAHCTLVPFPEPQYHAAMQVPCKRNRV